MAGKRGYLDGQIDGQIVANLTTPPAALLRPPLPSSIDNHAVEAPRRELAVRACSLPTLIFKAHSLLYHPTLGLGVIKKKKTYSIYQADLLSPARLGLTGRFSATNQEFALPPATRSVLQNSHSQGKSTFDEQGCVVNFILRPLQFTLSDV